MIIRVAFVLLAGVVTAACAASRPLAAPASVPPGCDISGARVHWSPPTKQPRLTRVTLFRVVPGDASTYTGKQILDEPLTPTITDLAAPAGWTTALARSLSAETGDPVKAEPALSKDGGYSLATGSRDDPSIPETLFYEGAEVVSARFTVDCAPPASGTFTSWTTLTQGAVHCGQIEEPEQELGRLARRHCPRTPAPRPS